MSFLRRVAELSLRDRVRRTPERWKMDGWSLSCTPNFNLHFLSCGANSLPSRIKRFECVYMWTTTLITILLDAAEKDQNFSDLLSRQHQHLSEHLSNFRSHGGGGGRQPGPRGPRPSRDPPSAGNWDGGKACWVRAWTWLGHPGTQSAFMLQPLDGAKIKGITGRNTSKASVCQRLPWQPIFGVEKNACGM